MKNTKTISLKEAHQILEECSAVIADDNALTYPSLSDLEDDDSNEFLYISWTDDEGLTYSAKFQEGENQSVKISGSSMFLIDNEGDEMQITILEPKSLED